VIGFLCGFASGFLSCLMVARAIFGPSSRSSRRERRYTGSDVATCPDFGAHAACGQYTQEDERDDDRDVATGGDDVATTLHDGEPAVPCAECGAPVALDALKNGRYAFCPGCGPDDCDEHPDAPVLLVDDPLRAPTGHELAAARRWMREPLFKTHLAGAWTAEGGQRCVVCGYVLIPPADERGTRRARWPEGALVRRDAAGARLRATTDGPTCRPDDGEGQ